MYPVDYSLMDNSCFPRSLLVPPVMAFGVWKEDMDPVLPSNSSLHYTVELLHIHISPLLPVPSPPAGRDPAEEVKTTFNKNHYLIIFSVQFCFMRKENLTCRGLP